MGLPFLRSHGHDLRSLNVLGHAYATPIERKVMAAPPRSELLLTEPPLCTDGMDMRLDIASDSVVGHLP